MEGGRVYEGEGRVQGVLAATTAPATHAPAGAGATTHAAPAVTAAFAAVIATASTAHLPTLSLIHWPPCSSCCCCWCHCCCTFTHPLAHSLALI